MAQALKYNDKLTGLPFQLDCAKCPRNYQCDEYGTDKSKWKYEGRPIFKTEWIKCPVEYLKDPRLKITLETLQDVKISPIAGWPFDFSHWFVEYMRDIHQAIEERKAEENHGNW